MAQLTLPPVFPFVDPSVPYVTEWMRVADIEQVMPIERLSFPAPWPASAYQYELTQNELSSYLVLRPAMQTARRRLWDPLRFLRGEARFPVLAYGGFWIMVDEGHISTIAVHPDWRGRGLGELMLVALLDAAILRNAAELTLEVRVSNRVAQNLYRKYSFSEVGLRKRYYHDNNEDALIMTTPRVGDPVFSRRYDDLKRALRKRLGAQAGER